MPVNDSHLPTFPADFIEEFTNPKFPELEPLAVQRANQIIKLAEKLMVARFANFNGVNGVGARLTEDIELAYRTAQLLIEYREKHAFRRARR